MIDHKYTLLSMFCMGAIVCSACTGASVSTDSTVQSEKTENSQENETHETFAEAEASTETEAVSEEQTTPAAETTAGESASSVPETVAEESAASVPETVTEEPTTPVPETSAQEPTTNVSAEITRYDAFFVAGNSAYEQYGYDEKLADRYAAAISSAGLALSDIANVYNIIVPISIGVTLPDEYVSQVNPADQRSAINKLYSKMNSNVKTVSIFDSLYEHRDEYLYFRTDHHWTALAAYYAYEDFCAVKGITPNPLSGYKTITFEGFLGSFYTWSDNNPALGNTPDYVKAYYPLASSTSMVCENKEKTFNWPVINDVSSYKSYNKYGTFIGGDNAFTTITNADLHDGSSCVVIKESFGNAFVPFLVDHYETVYVIDFREYEGKLTDFVKENGVQDVIYINSISMTRGGENIDQLAGILK